MGDDSVCSQAAEAQRRLAHSKIDLLQYKANLVVSKSEEGALLLGGPVGNGESRQWAAFDDLDYSLEEREHSIGPSMAVESNHICACFLQTWYMTFN